MADKFGRDFAIAGCVALVKGRIKNSYKPLKMVESFVDSVFKSKNLLEGMQFTSVGLLYLYGELNDLNLVFQKIHRTFKDLPVELQLNMEVLEWADRNNLLLLQNIFMIAALEAVIQVGNKYNFDISDFQKERDKLGHIPNSVLECQSR